MMNKINNNRVSIGKTFIENDGKEMHMRELERLSHIDIKTLYKELKLLVEGNILDYVVRGKNKSYFLKNNIDVELFLIMVEAYRTDLFLQKNKPIKNYFMELSRICEFIIFGSYANNTQTEQSDMDIVIFSEDTEDIRKILGKFNIKIQPHFISYEEFEQKKEDTLVREILKKHVLFGKYNHFVRMWMNERNRLVQETT